MEIVKIEAEKYGLEKQQVSNVDLAFEAKVKERELLTEIYTKLITKDITKEVAIEARNLRLSAVKVKTGVSKIHKTQKGFALAFGKYCDAWKNKETEPIQQMIDGALEIEKFEEIKEQKRIAELQIIRANEVTQFLDAENIADISEELGSMPEQFFIPFLAGLKSQYTKRIEAEKQAEIARLNKIKLDAEEKEIIRKENERLRAEANEVERLTQIEANKRLRIENERKAIETKERLERQAKANEQQIIYENKLKAERLEKANIAKELADKEAFEQKRLADIETAKQAELAKGDSDKVIDLINELTALKTKFTFESSRNIKKYNRVGLLIDKVIADINK